MASIFGLWKSFDLLRISFKRADLVFDISGEPWDISKSYRTEKNNVDVAIEYTLRNIAELI